MALHKDEVLDRLAMTGNVAQFVAFRPNRASVPTQSYLRIAGHEPNELFLDPGNAIDALLAASGEGKVNVRSYSPDQPQSREFVYGLASIDAALGTIRRLTAEGLHTIVNETIDVSDGGVSGVVQADAMEFAPDDTPRCVEKPGVASLPFKLGIEILRIVYGFRPDLDGAEDQRIEFSIHPRPRGWRRGHTLIWEREAGLPRSAVPAVNWPNRFSRFIGDKAFGLLVAHLLGATVPRTLVISRRVAPFEFGRRTDSPEVWTRTCPRDPHPGLYTTLKGWTDPFSLICTEDPDGTLLASLLRQDAVSARYSGAAIVAADGRLTIEGRQGEGDRLMLGLEKPEALPTAVTEEVETVHRGLSATLGPVRIEWVHDGSTVWIVQLHLGQTQTAGSVVVPGHATTWVEFHVEDGLERLRDKLDSLPPDAGILLIGQIGVTSHFADVLRRAGAPARLSVRG